MKSQVGACTNKRTPLPARAGGDPLKPILNPFSQNTGTALEEAYAALSVVAQQQRRTANGGAAAPCRRPPAGTQPSPIGGEGAGGASGAATDTADAELATVAAAVRLHGGSGGGGGSGEISGIARGYGGETPETPGGVGENTAQKWLVIGIPTFPRPGDPYYLGTTLEALLAELPAPVPGGGPQPFGPDQARERTVSMPALERVLAIARSICPLSSAGAPCL